MEAYDTPGATSPWGFGLHHTQLAMPAGAEDVARAFWVDLLGMVEVAKPPALAARGGLWVRAERIEIHLGVEDPFVPARKAHPGILVGDLDGLAAHLSDRGIEPRWDEAFPWFRRFYVDDPFGNRLEFLSPREGYVGPDHDWSSVTGAAAGADPDAGGTTRP